MCSGRVPRACVRLVSALIPPHFVCYVLCVRRVSTLCPPWVPLAAPPNLVRFVSARLAPASKSCMPLVSASCVSTMCPFFVRHVPTLCQLTGPPYILASGLCPRVACCGAGPYEARLFLSIAQPAAFILHACWSVSLAFILAPQIRPLQARPVLVKLFGHRREDCLGSMLR